MDNRALFGIGQHAGLGWPGFNLILICSMILSTYDFDSTVWACNIHSYPQ